MMAHASIPALGAGDHISELEHLFFDAEEVADRAAANNAEAMADLESQFFDVEEVADHAAVNGSEDMADLERLFFDAQEEPASSDGVAHDEQFQAFLEGLIDDHDHSPRSRVIPEGVVWRSRAQRVRRLRLRR